MSMQLVPQQAQVARTTDEMAQIMERVMLVGDLSKLTAQERVHYYLTICQSLGLNPATRPFDYIVLNGRLTLYAKRDATDQLRRRDRISVNIVSRERLDDVYVVTARATDPDGRQDESIGAVCIAGLKGEALANALMKAETKAKRRVTLSICGLGFPDESEIDSIPGARRVYVNDAGEIEGEEPIAPTPAMSAATEARQTSNPLADLKNHLLKLGVKPARFDEVLQAKVGKKLGEMTPDDAVRALDVLQNGAAPVAAEQVATSEASASETAQTQAAKWQPSQAQIKRLYAIGKAHGIEADQVKEIMKSLFDKEHFSDLTRQEYDELAKALESGMSDEPALGPEIEQLPF